MLLNMTESSPVFGVYDLSEVAIGATVETADTPALLTFQGFPLAPTAEAAVGQWMLPRASLYGYFDEQGRGISNPAAGQLRPHLLTRGLLALRVTDAALRITVLDGSSPELGRFVAGRQLGLRPIIQSRITTLSCVWMFSDIWAVDAVSRPGGRRAIRVIGPSGPGLILGRAGPAQESFLKTGLPTAHHATGLADLLISALIGHARHCGDSSRAAAADEVEAARRDSGHALSVPARFRRADRGAQN